jgi:ABC-type phosphate transport system permease subunit
VKTPENGLITHTVGVVAGVSSIIYGIFGLGFFVYGIGGSIDSRVREKLWFMSI